MTFDEILDRAKALHAAKDADYASAETPYANLRRCERLGMEAWQGSMIRLFDKVSRLETLVHRERDGAGPQVQESIEDTLIDMLNYCAITIVLRSERGLQSPSSDSESAPPQRSTTTLPSDVKTLLIDLQRYLEKHAGESLKTGSLPPLGLLSPGLLMRIGRVLRDG